MWNASDEMRSEQAAAAVAAMDSETHDRFVMAMLSLSTDPRSQGDIISPEGPTVTERAMALGTGLIVYTVDDSAVRVRVVNIVWLV